ncbi:MAG TPA: hypothetical protein VND64_02080 [Pirellulales bacterium]|nr:hypothetical protein [Pirellulales bacterium]
MAGELIAELITQRRQFNFHVLREHLAALGLARHFAPFVERAYFLREPFFRQQGAQRIVVEMRRKTWIGQKRAQVAEGLF